MISFEFDSNKFQYRAAGIVIQNNRVLLQRIANEALWFIPGGRVEFNETAEEAIDREFEEEFGVAVSNKKLLWLAENFVEFPERRVHEIGVFFYIELAAGQELSTEDEEFIAKEDIFVNKWVDLDRLDEYTIVPEFVTQQLKLLDKDKGIQHIVNRSVR